MKYVLLLLCLGYNTSFAQSRFTKLQHRFDSLEQAMPYRESGISFILTDIKTGKILFEKNKTLILPPASTLKTFTTASALHFLGPDFRYRTRVAFQGSIKKNIGYGKLIVYGSGDPSLGSDRFEETKPELVKKQIVYALKKLGIKTLKGRIEIVSDLFTDEGINRGWLEEDIANYYGAGVYGCNWKENKFEISMTPNETSFDVVSNTAGYDNQHDFCVELIHKDGATTEEAFAFFEHEKTCRYALRGFLTNNEKIQSMQLARLHPDIDLKNELEDYLKREIDFEEKDTIIHADEKTITTILSPPLSKLVYWCNQKSLNLYADAFCKTIAATLYKKGNWPAGISAMLNFANKRGIDTKGVSLLDACGLSPENKITTHILAQMLRKNTGEKWYPVFYESLPLINELHMKSGYIGGTRSYTGYLTLKDGRKTCFAFILHHYSSTPKEAKLEMFKILDLLK